MPSIDVRGTLLLGLLIGCGRVEGPEGSGPGVPQGGSGSVTPGQGASGGVTPGRGASGGAAPTGGSSTGGGGGVAPSPVGGQGGVASAGAAGTSTAEGGASTWVPPAVPGYEPIGCQTGSFGPTPTPHQVLFLVDASQGASSNVGEISAWEAFERLVTDIVEAAGVADFSVAVDFFPPNPGQGDVDASAPATCEPSSTPAVDFSLASGAGEAVAASFLEQTPSGDRALGPAFLAGLDRLEEVSAPDDARVIVVVTSGAPDACSPLDLEELGSQAAASDTQSVLMAVTPDGSPFQEPPTGFERELVVAGDDLGSATEFFANAFGLWRICSMPVPPLGNDFNGEGIVDVTPPGEPTERLRRVEDEASCDSGDGEGWHFDRPGYPSGIFLCPRTCERTRGGVLDYQLGCEP